MRHHCAQNLADLSSYSLLGGFVVLFLAYVDFFSDIKRVQYLVGSFDYYSSLSLVSTQSAIIFLINHLSSIPKTIIIIKASNR